MKKLNELLWGNMDSAMQAGQPVEDMLDMTLNYLNLAHQVGFDKGVAWPFCHDQPMIKMDAHTYKCNNQDCDLILSRG